MSSCSGPNGEAYAGKAVDIDGVPQHHNCPCTVVTRDEDADQSDVKRDCACDDHGYGDAPLHRLWTKAVDIDGYDKDEWLELEKLVHAGIKARRPEVESRIIAIEKVVEMAQSSLPPDDYDALHKLLEYLARTQHLGWTPDV